MDQEAAFHLVEQIEDEIGKVIVGQPWLIRRLMIGLFSKIPYSFKRGEEERTGCGHILLEGVPGLAKTLTIMTLANTIQAKFQRIQFTPDLMPADILGTRIYDPTLGTFRTEKGPIFSNIVLADEINRATPKTQSALLEAMQERQVTLGEVTTPLEDPFWVLATQNPVEQEGVYTLPEAQADRFAMKIKVEYPSHEDEIGMLRTKLERAEIKQIIVPQTCNQIRELISNSVYVDDKIREYIVRLGRATRNSDSFNSSSIKEMISYGVSPRSYHHMMALAHTMAFFHGRDYVLPIDVKTIAMDAMRHRVVRSLRAEVENVTTEEIIEEILKKVPIP